MAVKIFLQKIKGEDQRIVEHSLDKLIPDIDSSYISILIDICDTCDKLMESRSKINEMLIEANKKSETQKQNQECKLINILNKFYKLYVEKWI